MFLIGGLTVIGTTTTFTAFAEPDKDMMIEKINEYCEMSSDEQAAIKYD